MAVASLSVMGYFMPIFAFLLVFIVIYAILVKTKILGENQAVMLFISLILASFFVVEASLVEFIEFTSAWFGVIIILLFFIFVILAFFPGDKPLEFLTKAPWVAWTVLGIMVAFFIISSAFVFNWAVNWGEVQSWFGTEWFGMILLVVIAAVVSWKIKG